MYIKTRKEPIIIIIIIIRKITTMIKQQGEKALLSNNNGNRAQQNRELIIIFYLYYYYYSFGACILWDSGSNVGEIKGHSKSINSIAYKPTRPFRIATASEDTTCAFFEGPPFKFVHTMKVR